MSHRLQERFYTKVISIVPLHMRYEFIIIIIIIDHTLTHPRDSPEQANTGAYKICIICREWNAYWVGQFGGLLRAVNIFIHITLVARNLLPRPKAPRPGFPRTAAISEFYPSRSIFEIPVPGVVVDFNSASSGNRNESVPVGVALLSKR